MLDIIKQTKVENINDRPNQFIIHTANRYAIFQSYNTIIAVIDHKEDKTTLDINNWDYSVTTGKYRNIFLGEKRAETQKKINNGIYKLANLN